jgi:hypothetical protein
LNLPFGAKSRSAAATTAAAAAAALLDLPRFDFV